MTRTARAAGPAARRGRDRPRVLVQRHLDGAGMAAAAEDVQDVRHGRDMVARRAARAKWGRGPWLLFPGTRPVRHIPYRFLDLSGASFG